MDVDAFSEAEKIRLFDDLASRYYQQNFGTMLKADIDVLLFSAYLNHRLDASLPCDEYTISVDLGIKETRVRSLMESKQLKYPREIKWREDFVALVPNARYQSAQQLVQMPIPNVNLMREIRHYMESKGWFNEYSLNPKLFQCRLDFFLELCCSLDGEVSMTEADKQALQELQANAAEPEQNIIEMFRNGDITGGIKTLVLNSSEDIADDLLEKIPVIGSLAKTAIRDFVKHVKKKK